MEEGEVDSVTGVGSISGRAMKGGIEEGCGMRGNSTVDSLPYCGRCRPRDGASEPGTRSSCGGGRGSGPSMMLNLLETG